MKYFTMYEMIRSEYAIRNRIENKTTITIEQNLTNLVDKVLDPLRVLYGKPITVSSGYRSSTVNKSVKGSITSQHLYGEAADITAGTKEENKKLARLIATKLPYDQLIVEYGGQWIHVSLKRVGANRKEIRKTSDGKSYPIIKATEI